ncbi:MAG: hemolysin III family protein [Spirochaetes bacterium]|nr:hemolysin III family protein [Spirochaetota bacterium]
MSNETGFFAFFERLKSKKKERRELTVLEEVFNAITHGLGVLLAIAATVILVVVSIKNGRPASIVAGTAIFGATMIFLYLMSTLYHSLIFTKAASVFQVFDHCAIFFLIAGTYTVVSFQVGGAFGWMMFGVIWGLAIIGVVFEAVFKSRVKKLSMILYVVMGWFLIFVWNPVLDSVNYGMIKWLLAGGIAYTGGIIFYKLQRKYFFHILWHIAVVTGTVLHFFGILFYIV